MRATVGNIAQLGDLVVAAFDEAALYREGPEEVSDLATRTVRYMLRHARKASILPLSPATCPKKIAIC